jgi:hypothetical protein
MTKKIRSIAVIFTVALAAVVLHLADGALGGGVATAQALNFGKNTKALKIQSTYTYDSESLQIIQGKFVYKGAECYVNKIWMKSPGNQIKKVSNAQVQADFEPVYKLTSDDNLLKAYANASNTSTKTLIDKMTSTPVLAINGENVAKNDTLSVENGKVVLERVKYSDKAPRHNGIAVNAGKVAPFLDIWRENIFKLQPSFTISAANIYDEAALIKGGKIVKSSKKTGKSARTVFGKAKSGDYFTLTVNAKGLTMKELRELCLKFDLEWAVNLSGAADTSLHTMDDNTKKLQTTYSASNSAIYSMIYFTEYNKNDLARPFSSNMNAADFPPFKSDYVKFVSASTNGTKNPLSNKIAPEFGAKLEKVALYLGATKKKPLVINSGFRTDELQRKNWVKAYKKGGYKVDWNGWLMDKRTKKDIVACPGKSPHRTGFAVDIPYTSIAGKLRKLEKTSPDKLKNDFGLCRPLRHEDWHFELYRVDRSSF